MIDFTVPDATTRTSPTRYVFSRKAWNQWNSYVSIAKGEISVLAYVRYSNDGIHIEKMYLPKQKNTGSTTEMDSEDVGAWITSEAALGENVGLILSWIHSHNDFGVFWSATDESNIARLGTTMDIVYSIVTNKKEEKLGRIDIFKPFKARVDNVPVYIEAEHIDNYAEYELEVTSKCGVPFFENTTEESWCNNAWGTPKYQPWYERERMAKMAKNENPKKAKLHQELEELEDELKLINTEYSQMLMSQVYYDDLTGTTFEDVRESKNTLESLIKSLKEEIFSYESDKQPELFEFNGYSNTAF